ncbi:hypothetical protein, partial [Burkholderia pseudomallei]|uniref:hypothetical protein n=1 Tax=Burkholderia pseudomallei TaxID=28450 RepID=UPI00358EAFA1
HVIILERINWPAVAAHREKAALACCREGLKMDAFCRADSFFEVCGNSLPVALIAARVGAEVGLARLGAGAFFRYPTVAALAAHMGGQRGDRRIAEERAGAEPREADLGADARGDQRHRQRIAAHLEKAVRATECVHLQPLPAARESGLFAVRRDGRPVDPF